MRFPPARRASSAKPRHRVWLMIGLGLAVLLLHLVALDWLGNAFSPWAVGKQPEPIYTELLKPTAPPKPAQPPQRKVVPKPIAKPAPTVAARTEQPPTPAPTPAVVVAFAPHSSASSPPPASAPALASNLSDDVAWAPVSQPAGGASGLASGPTTPHQAPAASSPASDASPSRAEAPAWPPSTRLNYTITGYWRGDLHGSGALVWSVDGDHYEATLSGSALIGFAYRSTGRIDGDWLAPSHYTERVFTREKSVRFDRGDDTLHFSASATVLPLPPHVQDSASLFLQIANRLTRHPADFHPGATLSFAVARPSGMTDWTFTVAGKDTVVTPIGALSCWHVVRAATEPNQLGAQIWLAPQLQNLPVQIRLQHAADSFLLFTLDQAEQVAPPARAASAAR